MSRITTPIKWALTGVTALLVLWAMVDVAQRQWRLHGPGVERAAKTLTVLHWGNPEEAQIVADLIEAFGADHPDIEVRRLHASDYDAKLKTMLAAGTPPDLFYLRYEDVAEFADLGIVMPLDDELSEDYLSTFYPLLVDAFRFDREDGQQGRGSLYGVPKDFTTLLCYVNLDLFAQAGVGVPYDGWTWGEYERAMGAITALDEEVYGGVLLTWPLVLRQMVWSHGGAYFGDGFSDIAIGEPGGIAALDTIRRLRFERGSVYNATGISQDEMDLFRRGRIGAIGPLGRWMVPRYRKIDAFDWDVVPMPVAEGVEPKAAIATVAWAVARQTREPDAAVELLRFLCGREGQRMQAELGLAMPSDRAVGESDAFLAPGQRPAHAQTFLDLIEVAQLAPEPTQKIFGRILDDEMRETLNENDKTAEQAAADVAERWAEELASPLQTKPYRSMPWGVVLTVLGLIVAGLIGYGVVSWRRQGLGAVGAGEAIAGWMFIGPWATGFVLLIAGPMVVSLLLALTKWSAMSPLAEAKFVGIDNFVHLFRFDPAFYQSLWVTSYYTLLAVPITQAAAIGIALLMNQALPGIGLFRTAYFVPSVVTGVALVTLWITLFNTDEGLLNAALGVPLGWFGLEPPDWFGTDAAIFAVPGVTLMTLWGVGGGMIIYLAGLKNIPGSLYEAATIDGAGPVRKFFAVTAPMLSPLIFFNLIMAIIASFQVFTQAYVIRGSASSTNEHLMFYVLNLYDHAFRFHNMGYASAMAWVLFVILMTLTLLVFRGSKGLVHYEGLKA
ncbi:MAG: extracellular solute-binding protein [Planctomycetota bacterium]